MYAVGNLSRRRCAMRSLYAGVPKLTSDLAGTWISGEYVRTCRPRRDASRLRLLEDRGAGPRSTLLRLPARCRAKAEWQT